MVSFPSYSTTQDEDQRLVTHASQGKFELVPIIPEELEREVTQHFHDSPANGYFGINKTLIAIKQRFFWNNMNKEIKDYVRPCVICQKQKRKSKS